jgi:hypothetical protein
VEDGANEACDMTFWWLSDEMLLRAIESPDVADALNLHREARRQEELARASELARGVLRRSLYKIAYLASRDDLRHGVDRIWANYGTASKRRVLEDSMAELSGLPSGYVLVHLPKPSGLAKLADVRVLADHDEIVTLEEWDREHSGRLAAINAAHSRLWRATVYIHPEVDEKSASLVRAIGQDIFGAPSRYRSSAGASAYTQELFTQEAITNNWSIADMSVLAEVQQMRLGTSLEDARAELSALISAYRMHRLSKPEDATDS